MRKLMKEYSWEKELRELCVTDGYFYQVDVQIREIQKIR